MKTLIFIDNDHKEKAEQNKSNAYHKLKYTGNLDIKGGLTELKGKIFIDTATYLRDTLERAIEHYPQSVYIMRCIENNYIIHYDEDIETFKRLRVDINSADFLQNEDIDLVTLLQ